MSRRTLWFVLAGLAIALAARAYAAATANWADARSVRVIAGANLQYLLAPAAFRELGSRVLADYDVTPGGTVFLWSDNVVYAGHFSGGQFTLSRLQSDDGCVDDSTRIRSLALDASGALLFLEGDRVCRYGDTGETVELFWTPSVHLAGHIAHSATAGRAYLYGGDPKTFGHRVIAINSGGTVQNVVEAPSSLAAVTESKDGLYFATKAGEIFEWSARRLRLVTRLPQPLSIVSIAVPPKGGILYFSTSDEVYAVKGLIGVSVATNLGGTLRARGNALYVLDRPRQLLVRIDGVASL